LAQDKATLEDSSEDGTTLNEIRGTEVTVVMTDYTTGYVEEVVIETENRDETEMQARCWL
jgi:hypothetical protein